MDTSKLNLGRATEISLLMFLLMFLSMFGGVANADTGQQLKQGEAQVVLNVENMT